MSSIIKRGNSYRAEISNYKHGYNKKLSKTFPTRAEATRWALQQELTKANGIDLAQRETPFAEFFERFVYLVKKNDVRPATFVNYQRVIPIVKHLFNDISLSRLNDSVVQMKIDEYALTHSRKTVHEVLLKIRTSLHYAYGRGLISTDFASLVKTRGLVPPKRNKALSITDFKKLRQFLLNNHDSDFNVLVLLALETGARRGELLGLKTSDIYEYGVHITRSISPTSNDTRLKTEHSRRNVSINKEVYTILKSVQEKPDGYLFDPDGFHQSAKLAKLLKNLDIPKTTFHGLRDSHASILFANDSITLDYISQRLGHASLLTTQQYYLSLMPEKQHELDHEALDLLNSL